MTKTYEEFIVSETSFRFYSLVGEENKVQYWSIYFELTEHILLGQKATQPCKDYFKTSFKKITKERLARELIKSRQAVKQKYQSFKNAEFEAQYKREETYKPHNL